jgi:predicted metal-binding membrane protein
MSTTALERVVRRDRAIVAAALALITLLAWAYVVRLAGHMHMAAGGDATADASMAMMRPNLAAWSGGDAVFMFAMWAVMMTAMMTPSVAPMILVHARVARQAHERKKPFAATGWFAAGYFLAWTGFAAAATAAQWGLERAALLTPVITSASHLFGAAVLIAAGVYQWTPVKEACLSQCQSPLLFLQRHGGLRADLRGSLSLGARHGLYCIGCCWTLMLLLFVGGVMNVLWAAAIAGFVLLEKLVPPGWMLSRAAGVGLVVAGLGLAAVGFP